MGPYNMSSHNRRKHQRWLNAYCRKVNKSIEKDDLWQGRFVVKQIATDMYWFTDKSGGLMYCRLLFYDKKTGITAEWFTDNLDVQTHMFWRMNDFIIKDCKVWENEHPYEERRNYR